MATTELHPEKRDLLLAELDKRMESLKGLIQGTIVDEPEWDRTWVKVDVPRLRIAIGDMRSLLTELNKIK